MSAATDIYSIPQDLLDFRETIGQIARERIAPRAAEIDESCEPDLGPAFAGVVPQEKIAFPSATQK